MAKRFKNPYFYPASGDYFHAALLDADPFIRFHAENGEQIQTQLMGAYNFENIAVALCIGKFFGVDPHEANRAVAEYIPGNMRSQIVKKNSNTIILDAYNANPSSMEAAILNLASMKATKKIAILGDMFELEEEASKEHRRIGELLKEKKFDQVYLCGQLMKSAREVFPSVHYFENKEQLIEDLKRSPIQEATILVKASRGIGLETVVEYLS
jgi:UDP-N-acetylmuramoyl-tripeptide--D-alanyl-D-alanine ligase